MDDDAFDRALIASAFTVAADRGWAETTVTAAARAAGLPLDRARGRFTGRGAVLARFGRIADQTALAEATAEGSNRDRLFGLVMRRIDVMQAHRGGVLALKTFLPTRPLLSAALWGATLSSMAWLLEAAGIPTQGARGALRVQGLGIIWLRTLRAWENDDGEDLSATMAALDRGLDQAVRAEGWLGGRGDGSAGTDAGPDAISDPPADIAASVDTPTPATAFGTSESSGPATGSSTPSGASSSAAPFAPEPPASPPL